jgi:hypothetical protein
MYWPAIKFSLLFVNVFTMFNTHDDDFPLLLFYSIDDPIVPHAQPAMTNEAIPERLSETNGFNCQAFLNRSMNESSHSLGESWDILFYDKIQSYLGI